MEITALGSICHKLSVFKRVNKLKAILILSVVCNINSDGSYIYEEGAVLLKGEYSFDGSIITFKKAYFARLSNDATTTQQASQYNFWATIKQNGDLQLFDCEQKYAVTEENEQLNPMFVSMARFYPISSPLNVISANNLRNSVSSPVDSTSSTF